MPMESSLQTAVAAVIALAGTAHADDIPLQPSILFTNTTTLPFDGNPLIPEAGDLEGAIFGGQPRIDNDGNYTMLSFLPIFNANDPEQVTRDTTTIRNNQIILREGLRIPGAGDFVPLSDFPFTQQPYQDIDVNSSGIVAQVLTATDDYVDGLDGLPSAADLQFPDSDVIPLLLVDGQFVLKDGDETSLLPGFTGPRSAIVDLSAASINDNNQVLVRSEIDTNPSQFGSDVRVIFRIDDPLGSRTLTPILSTQAGDILPGAGFDVATYGADESDLAFNNHGDFITSVDVRGASGTTDGAIVLYDGDTGQYQVLAREGSLSQFDGRNWVSVMNVPVALNNQGDWSFRGRLSGNSTTNSILVVNGQKVAQEGDPVFSLTGERVLQLGNADANIQMDQEGNVLWYAAWNAPKAEVCPDNADITSSFAIWEGIYFNDRLLIEAGRTSFKDVTLGSQFFPELVAFDIPNTIGGGFTLSPDGDRLIVALQVAEPSDDICAYSINNDATPRGTIVAEIDLERFRNCIAIDVDSSNQLDEVDLSAFLSVVAGAANGLGADLNEDGSIDFTDVVEFLNRVEDCTSANG